MSASSPRWPPSPPRAAPSATASSPRLQDPRKEVLNIRNLFPDKIALRLDEPTQADLVLGDGAHDRGALCEEISADPATGAGVGYVRLETSPDPVRVRAGFVTDTDIHDMAQVVAD